MERPPMRSGVLTPLTRRRWGFCSRRGRRRRTRATRRRRRAPRRTRPRRCSAAARRVQRCKNCESHLEGLARGDRELSLNDGQIPNPNVARVAPGMVYHRVEGNRRASRNGPGERSPTRNPSSRRRRRWRRPRASSWRRSWGARRAREYGDEKVANREIRVWHGATENGP